MGQLGRRAMGRLRHLAVSCRAPHRRRSRRWRMRKHLTRSCEEGTQARICFRTRGKPPAWGVPFTELVAERLAPGSWPANTPNPSKRTIAMELLPPQLLPAVPHVRFGLFNLAIPDIIAWGVVIVLVAVGAWARLPRVLVPSERKL